jgi:hypothetical protein
VYLQRNAHLNLAPVTQQKEVSVKKPVRKEDRKSDWVIWAVCSAFVFIPAACILFWPYIFNFPHFPKGTDIFEIFFFRLLWSGMTVVVIYLLGMVYIYFQKPPQQ